MPLYMSQLAYTSEAWAAQVKHPANRIETIGRAAVEAAGGKVLGTWLCFGEYDRHCQSNFSSRVWLW